MYRDKTVGVVVPAFNEESQIEQVIRTMPDYIDHIIIVDDKSVDNTTTIVENLKGQNDRIHLIRHEANQGVGGAIATGYKFARDHDLDMAAVMAGDGQMNPKDLIGLLDPVVEDKTDYAKANRLASGKAFEMIPKIRYFGNAILSLFTKIVSGYWHVADSQSGYTVINKKALRAIDWDKMFKRYGQPNDLLVKLNVHNFRVMDVPQDPVYDVGEKSGIKVRKVIFTIAWLLLTLFFWRLKEKYIIRDFHPLIFFYFFGFISLILSIIFFIRVMYLWYDDGAMPEISFLSFIFTFTIGFQSIFFAMWFDFENNKHLKGV